MHMYKIIFLSFILSVKYAVAVFGHLSTCIRVEGRDRFISGWYYI